LRRTAARLPHKEAVICGKIGRSYGELDRICNRLANGLFAGGIRTGDRVAILSRNSHAFAAMRFALSRIGAVLVPIMLNAEEIAFIPRSSGATVLAMGADLAETGRNRAHLERSPWMRFDVTICEDPRVQRWLQRRAAA
jgi:fatty-acyl-CoA synthase